MTNQTIHEVFAYLRVNNANEAIAFYCKVFGAVERFRLTEPGGRIGHAELLFGSHSILISDEYPEFGIHAPKQDGNTGMSIHLHVADVDQLTDQIVKAGGKLIMEPKNQFYGERSSKVLDPFGHEWLLGSHIEDVSYEEMQRRFNTLCQAES